MKTVFLLIFFCCLSIISLVCEVVLFVNIFKFKVNRFMLFCHFYSFSPSLILLY